MSWWYLRPADCFLCHIPKNGGSSIREGVFDMTETVRVDGGWGSNGGFPRLEFPTTGEPISMLKLSRSFAMVRDPATRFWSAVAYVRENYLPDLAPWEALELAEDDRIPPEHPSAAGRARHHLLPQTHPFYGIGSCGALYPFEWYSRAVPDIADRFGFSTRLAPGLPHLRRRPEEAYDGEWTADMEKFYSADRELHEKVVDHYLEFDLPFNQ